MTPVGDTQLGYCQVATRGQVGVGGKPLTDQPVVLGLTGLGVPLAEVVVFAVESDHSLPCRLVLRYVGTREFFDMATFPFSNPVVYRVVGKLWAALPTIGR
jgi:hypothetical protein